VTLACYSHRQVATPTLIEWHHLIELTGF
jgi:hypothetical protein